LIARSARDVWGHQLALKAVYGTPSKLFHKYGDGSFIEILKTNLSHYRDTGITEIYFFRLPGDPPSSPEPACLAGIVGRRKRWRAGDGKQKVSVLVHNENLRSNK
jgi:hypothetical protein